jgi:hypothetical protein
MEDREFRIYLSSKGDEPVSVGIIGEKELERQVDLVRSVNPADTIYVREVFESVVRVYKPGEEVLLLGG